MHPDFLCIGFQKCGTTTMYDLLKQHKDIVLTQDVKEPMYYRVLGADKIGGSEWYEKRYFGHVEENDPRLKGEVNAGLAFTDCARKIGRDFPESTKLFFMMRNPVDRAYSAYKYFMALGFLPAFVMEDDRRHGHAAAFDRYCHYVLGNKKRRGQIMEKRLKYLVFSQGNYFDSIFEYMQYFPKKNMKFILFEDFVKDQKATCQDLYKFLEIEDDPTVTYNLKSNEGVMKASSTLKGKIGITDTGLHNLTYDILGISHSMPRFYAGYKKVHEKLQNYCLEEETDFSKMEPGTRALLQKYYAKQVRGVEKLMERDLSEVWY
jgi:hypothetical protein